MSLFDSIKKFLFTKLKLKLFFDGLKNYFSRKIFEGYLMTFDSTFEPLPESIHSEAAQAWRRSKWLKTQPLGTQDEGRDPMSQDPTSG